MNNMLCFKRILICLDLTEMDQNLLNYASIIAKYFKIHEMIFLHVIQAYDLPEESEKHYRNIYKSVDEFISNKLNQNLNKNILENIKTKIDIRIEKKDASEVIIEQIRRKNICLTLLGKKAESERKELYSARVIALGESDFLLIPANTINKIESILLATDLTKQSTDAFNKAIEMAKATNAAIHCQYIYKLSKKYFPLSLSEDQTTSIKAEAKKKQARFLKKVDDSQAPVSFSIEPAEYEKQVDKIFEKATENNAGIIMIGAKGRTSQITTALGYITEGLRKYESNIPVYINKNKLEKNSFWNIFFQG